MDMIVSAPQGVFPGNNFMTPNVRGYWRGNVRGVTAYAELSEGRGMTNEPIFGVTVRRANGERFEPELSKLLFSRADAVRYIEGLGSEA